MIRTFGVKRLLLSLLAAATGICATDKSAELLFAEHFEQSESMGRWSLPPGAGYRSSGGTGNSGCLGFTYVAPQNRLCVVQLDRETAAGRGLLVEGMLKGVNLTPPAKSYLGPKLMIHLKSPHGESWIDQSKQYGSYDWQKASVFVRVPADVETLELCLGLQGSTGTLFIDDVTVSLLPVEPRHSAAPATGKRPFRQTTRLRGVMSGHHLAETDIRELAENWRANLMRYQIYNLDKEDISRPEDYVAWVKRKLDDLDQVAAWCGKYGLKLLIDLHTGPGARQDGTLSNLLSFRLEDQNTLVRVWEMIAARYKSNPVIWGYDILNEPREDNYVFTPGGALDWNRLAERVALAIRGVDPRKPIVVQPAQGGSPAGLHVFNPIPVDNVVYSLHFYAPSQFTHQGVLGHPEGIVYPGVIGKKKWDKEALRRELQPVIDFQKTYRVPIYIGEFSAIRWAPGAARWLQDAIEIFEENGWDWTYHAFREYHGWSVEHGPLREDRGRKNDTVRKQLLLNCFRRNDPKYKE
jgi:hypothetical protein